MDEILLNAIINPWTWIFIFTLILSQAVVWFCFRLPHARHALRRRRAGLTGEDLTRYLPGHLVSARSAWSQIAALLVAATAVFLFVTYSNLANEEDLQSLTLVCTALILWMMVSGTEIAKAFIGGAIFQIIAAQNGTVRIGDRVTINEHHGRVIQIGLLTTKIVTLDDDAVRVPTYQLLTTTVVTANDGERSSLCNISFYLHPKIEQGQLKAAEDIVWTQLQNSCFCDVTQPLQVLIHQQPTHIEVTGRAYVLSTYEEALFRSEVSTKVIEAFIAAGIQLSLTHRTA